jgi:hypothetical protein
MVKTLPVVLAFGSLALAACGHGYGTPVAAARSRLSQANACPANRITVRERPDLAPLAWSNPPVEKPLPRLPPDVAADPARAALWRRQHADDERARELAHERAAEARSHREIVEAHGCGREVLYYCGLDGRKELRCRPTTLEALHRVDEKANLASRAEPK